MSDPAAPARALVPRSTGARSRSWSRPSAIPRCSCRRVRSVRRTTRPRARRGSSSPTTGRRRSTSRRCGSSPALRVELVLGDEQRGFAGNCNRGLRAARPDEDAVLLNSDVVAHAGWLEALQHAAYERRGAGIPARKLLYPDGTIQFAGMVRNPSTRSGSTTATAGKPADLPEAQVTQATLAVTGACMYITRAHARRDRPARRGLRDGLRGRRLLPARVGRRLPRRLRPRRRAHAPRVQDARARRRATRELRVAGALLGALGRLARPRATCAPRTAGCGSST